MSNERKVKLRQLEDAEEKQKLEDEKAFHLEVYKQLMDNMEADRRIMNEKFERAITEKKREMNICLQQGESSYAMMCQKQIQDLKKEKQQLNLSLQKELCDKPMDCFLIDLMTESLI